jgi:histidine triad (HIT) family protein
VAGDCLFCKIVTGDLSAERVDEDDHTVAFMDINPWTRGHALVVPRIHSRNIYEIDDESLCRTLTAAKRLACACENGSRATA